MNGLNSYAFSVGEIKQLPGKIEHVMLVEGITRETSFVNAYRKIMGDHASLLCRGDTYCKIDSPNNESVTMITQRRET